MQAINLLGPIDVPRHIRQTDVDEEFWHLDAATAWISDDLIALAAKMGREIDSRLDRIFTTHQRMLPDSSLKEELK
jgi:phosphoenolpyruvate-protein kinase (PTS system EI component)